MEINFRDELAIIFNDLQEYKLKVSDAILRLLILLNGLEADTNAAIEWLNRELTGYDGNHSLPLPNASAQRPIYREIDGEWGKFDDQNNLQALSDKVVSGQIVICGMGVVEIENQIETSLGNGILTAGQNVILSASKTPSGEIFSLEHHLPTDLSFFIFPNSLLYVYWQIRTKLCEIIRTIVDDIDNSH